MQNSIRATLFTSVRSRWYSTMAQTTAISPFSQAVVSTMRKLYVYNTPFERPILILEATQNLWQIKASTIRAVRTHHSYFGSYADQIQQYFSNRPTTPIPNSKTQSSSQPISPKPSPTKPSPVETQSSLRTVSSPTNPGFIQHTEKR